MKETKLNTTKILALGGDFENPEFESLHSFIQGLNFFSTPVQFKKSYTRAWEMAQWRKCLLFKYKDLSLNPSTP